MCRLHFNVLLASMKNFDYIQNRGCMYFACLIYFCWILIFCLQRTREFGSCSPLGKSLAFAFLCLRWQRYFWLVFVHANSLCRGTPVWRALIRQSVIIVTIVLISFIALLEPKPCRVPRTTGKNKPTVPIKCRRWKTGSQM